MERPIITTSEGKVQGTTLKSVLGTDYLAFRGIPYAQPPIGSLRFKKPELPLKWSGIRDASEYAGDIPMQKEVVGPGPYKVIGSEDCLYLNVYTKSIGHKKPVMFFIYGGGFFIGDANDHYYKEDYLVKTDAVLVWPNYRIGPMGFMNLNHKIASGNQGLRDLIFALKWVQRNIEAFGGDPNNVTIFGSSSGAYLTHLLTLIPASKGLLHKAIIQSGSYFALHSIMEVIKIDGFKIASHFGMESNDPIEVFDFLSKMPAEKLVDLDGILSLKESILTMTMLCRPVYDAPYTDEPIIPQPLDKLLTNDAHIPIIIGHTLDEYLLFFQGSIDNTETLKAYGENIEEYIKNSLHIKNPKIFPEIMKDIRQNYLKNKPINRENIWNLIKLLTDLFVIQDRKAIDLRNNYALASTYVYCFSYVGNEPTIFQYDHGPQPLEGVSHADELSYLIYLSYMRRGNDNIVEPLKDPKDRLVMERLIRMWYNFASTGNPTPKTDDVYVTTVWKPSSKDKLHYLDISDELIMKDDKDTDGWKLYEKYKQYMSFEY